MTGCLKHSEIPIGMKKHFFSLKCETKFLAFMNKKLTYLMLGFSNNSFFVS